MKSKKGKRQRRHAGAVLAPPNENSPAIASPSRAGNEALSCWYCNADKGIYIETPQYCYAGLVLSVRGSAVQSSEHLATCQQCAQAANYWREQCEAHYKKH